MQLQRSLITTFHMNSKLFRNVQGVQRELYHVAIPGAFSTLPKLKEGNSEHSCWQTQAQKPAGLTYAQAIL